MTRDDLFIDLESLVPGALETYEPDRVLAFIDLDRVEAWDWDGPPRLPPFPVIGVGDGLHPLARQLDTVIEPPVTLEAVTQQVQNYPQAAAVATDLLRLIEGLPLEAALVAESLAYGVLQAGAEHAAWLNSRRAGAQALPAGEVLLTRAGDGLIVAMNRPAAHNAVDRSMRDELREAFELAALDPGIQRVRLCGVGRTFSLGADLDEFGTTRDPAVAHAIRMRTLPAHAIARCAAKLEAHVQGACVGAGLEMAAFARRLTASPGAWFHLPELAMGLLPGAGGCVSLSRRIGRQRTLLLLLSGRRIGAPTARDWGLIDTIVDDIAPHEGQPYVVG